MNKNTKTLFIGILLGMFLTYLYRQMQRPGNVTKQP